jgi:DNA phosphorothioation-dependent restriction protein DptG
MQELRDIICFHYMTYFIQIATSLQREYNAIEDQLPLDEDYQVAFEHTVQPIFYGLAHEKASGTRRYTTEWDEGKIERAIYDSWGRLVVQRNLTEVAHDDETSVEPGAYTLTAAINSFDLQTKEIAIQKLTNEFPEDQQEDVPDDLSLAEFALRFAPTVRRYYTNMGSRKQSQTAYTLGYNAVLQLGKGVDREFIETRQRVGTISRLDRPGLRLLARLFEEESGDGHIEELWYYLRQRGIQLDHQSRQELIAELGDMGMIKKRSDGEEAIYVQTI